jgi:hypothetical protein
LLDIGFGSKPYKKLFVLQSISAIFNIKKYIKNLPYIECRDQNDEKRVCTQIPEVVYMFLFGNF